MSEIKYEITTTLDFPDFVERTSPLTRAAWPEFMFYDPVSKYFTDLYEKLGEYQFALVEKSTGKWIAMGNSVPLAFDGSPDDLPRTGWDWGLEKGVEDHNSGRKPTLLCAIQIVVAAEFKSKGMSIEAVRAMRSIAAQHNLSGMVAPVRPNLKALYPLTSIDDYVKWRRDDGLPFDAWMRVHARLGARIVKPCHEAMKITGTVADWEKWTGLRFPQTDRYVVPGALEPIEIDIESDRGTYVEPNVWMYHPFEK